MINDSRRREAGEWPEHGGRPERMLPRLGLDAGHGVLDFSANINPLGPPPWLARQLAATFDALPHYPDPDYTQARQAIARAEGVAFEQVRLTNGGAEAIFLAAALYAGQVAGRGRRAIIVQPTFAEYQRACRHYGIEATPIALDPLDFALNVTRAIETMREAEVVFLCRPNNPTGTLVAREVIESMLEAGRERGTTLVVDEAFIDFVTPDERLTPLLKRHDNLILLRSMTKLYAIPGLRLGYLLGSVETVRRVAELQMPWSVNAPAAALVEPLLTDSDFLDRTHAWLAAERPYLMQGLEAFGQRVIASRANFLLFQPGGETPQLLEYLAKAGILARHTYNFPGLNGDWLRVAVRSHQDNQRLLDVLAQWRPA